MNGDVALDDDSGNTNGNGSVDARHDEMERVSNNVNSGGNNNTGEAAMDSDNQEAHLAESLERRERNDSQPRRRLTMPLVDVLLGGGLLSLSGSDSFSDDDEAANESNNDGSSHSNSGDYHGITGLNIRSGGDDLNPFSEFELFGDLVHRYRRGYRDSMEVSSRDDIEDEFDDSDLLDSSYNHVGQHVSGHNGSTGNAIASGHEVRPAREHTYLPTAQPLYPEEWIPAGRHRRPRWSNASSSSAPTAKTDQAGDQFFHGCQAEANHFEKNCPQPTGDPIPYCTPYYHIPEPPQRGLPSLSKPTSTAACHASTPTKSANMTNNQHSDQTMSSPQSRVVLPILEIENVILFPGSTLPLRLRDSSWVDYLGNLIDDARGLLGARSMSRSTRYEAASSNAANTADVVNHMGEVRIGIVPRISARRTRRRPRDGGRMGRWRVDLIRRGVGMNMRRRSRRRQREDGGNDTVSADGGAINAVSSANEVSNGSVGAGAVGLTNGIDVSNSGTAQMSMAEQIDNEGQQATTGRNNVQPEDSNEDDYFHSTPLQVSSDDPLVGRVGTMATITFTHEETSLGVNESLSGYDDTTLTNTTTNQRSSTIWQRHRGELVVTAMGTKRFRILHSLSRENSHPNPRERSIPDSGPTPGIKLYYVEEWTNRNVPFPPVWMVYPPGGYAAPRSSNERDNCLQKDSKSFNEVRATATKSPLRSSHDNVLHQLSLRSSTPIIAYKTVWPWRVAEKICAMIQEMVQFQGLRNVLLSAPGVLIINSHTDGVSENTDSDTKDNIARLPSSPKQVKVTDPSAFVNWLASNLPLSQNELLDLLEMPCTVQQLRFIYEKIVKQKQSNDIFLRCKHCGATISPIRHLFTVGGADGTTGAYVNEHGVVHQTMTLRQVDRNSIVCVGQSETKDSWFPGYSWTIAYCSICSSHLGWKFLRVGVRNQRATCGERDDPDRPQMFWGLSSVTIEENVTPRRVFRIRIGGF